MTVLMKECNESTPKGPVITLRLFKLSHLHFFLPAIYTSLNNAKRIIALMGTLIFILKYYQAIPPVSDKTKGKFSGSVKLEGMRRERIRYNTVIF